MFTKRNTTRLIGVFAIVVLCGAVTIAIAAQQNTAATSQQGAASGQEKAKALEQQKKVIPPDRQKIKPIEMQKSDKAVESTLNDYYDKWLNEDVTYIISPEERNVFKALTTDEERENFIDQFWTRRSTDSREGANSYKIEHYRRIAYANEHFASGVPGWRTDRGRVYIIYGEPDGKESHPSGGSYQREFWEGGGSTSVYPFERWRYRHIDGVGDDVELEFVDKTFTNEYRLAMDPEEKDLLLTVPGAGLTESEELGLTNKEDRVNYGYMDQQTFQRAKDQPFERMAQYFNIQKPPEIKFADLRGIVTTRIVYNQLPYRMRTDFIKLSASRVLVPITVELDNSNLEFKKDMQFNRSRVNVYGQVISLTNAVEAEFEQEISSEYTDEFFEQGKNKRSIYQKIVSLRPGQRYRLDLVLKDLNSGSVGSNSYLINVPKFDGDELQASSVILANELKTVPPTYDHLEQFVIGDMKIQPNVKAEYRPGQILIPYLQVYNVQVDMSTFEPSLQVSYLIKSGDKVVQDIEDSRGQSAQFVSGQRVVLVRAFQLAELNPGKYRLEIDVLDKISNKRVATGADFEVVGSR